MADITTDNVTLDLGTGGALVATDYVRVDGITAHVQYVKTAYGASGGFIQVDSNVSPNVSGPLPVTLYNATGQALDGLNQTIQVDLQSSGTTVDISIVSQDGYVAVAGNTLGTIPVTVAGDSAGGPVSVAFTSGIGTLAVEGVSGGTLIGITASNLDIRGMTLQWDLNNYDGAVYGTTGDIVGAFLVRGLSAGSSLGVPVDSVAVQGLQNGRPVIVDTPILGSAINKPILTAGYTGSYGGTYDFVGIQGVSGGYPVPSVLAHGPTGSLPPGYTKIGNSGDALLVSLQESSVIANVNFPASMEVVGFTGPAGLSAMPAINYGLLAGVPTAVGMSGDAFRVSLAENISVSVGNVTVSNPSLVVTGTGGVANEVVVGGTAGANPIIAAGIAGATLATETTTQSIFDALPNGINAGGSTLPSFEQSATIITDTGTINTNVSTLKTDIANAVDASNRIKVFVDGITASPPTFVSGSVEPATGSIPTQLPTGAIRGVKIKAHPSNTILCYVTNVTASATELNSYPIAGNEDVFFEIDNLDKVYVWSTVAGMTVSWLGS